MIVIVIVILLSVVLHVLMNGNFVVVDIEIEYCVYGDYDDEYDYDDGYDDCACACALVTCRHGSN